MSEYYSVTEYAKSTGKDSGNIRRMLISGRLPGEKIGNQWVIRKGTEYPSDERIKSGKYQNWRKCTKFNSENTGLSKIVRRLIRQLRSLYGEDLKEIILYGSYARGTQTDESDIDIALLLNSGYAKKKHDKMMDFLVDTELECGKVISVVTIDNKEFDLWKEKSPFYKNVRKEGIVLWKTA